MRTTSIGSSVTNYFGDVTITFPSVSVAGNTSLTDATAGILPNGFSACPGCPAFDLSTGATFSGPANLCFYVPAVSAADLPNLKVLHDAGSGLADNGTSHVNVAGKQVCAQTNSFSPFVIAKAAAPTAAPATISGTIMTSEGAALGGVVVTLPGPRQISAITNSNGFYEFADLETDNFYTLTPQIANYSFTPQSRSLSLLGNKTDAVFTANPDASGIVNPLDTPGVFVRQQYLDFLGREPDQGGLEYWSDQINRCNGDAVCVQVRRIDVSAAFFSAPEAQQTGSYIYDTYTGVLDRKPGFAEYVIDRQQVVGGANLEAQKTPFAQNFVRRPEFVARYQSDTTAESFVDALLLNVHSSGGDLSGERSSLLVAYSAGANINESRAFVLRAIADNAAFKQSQYNAAFVLSKYFGYLRRDAETEGFNFWLNVLNNSDPQNDRGMVCSFLTSVEYQRRFGPIVSHSNAECGR